MNPQKAWNLLHIFHRIFHRLERNILRQMLPPDNQPTHIPSDVRFLGYDVHIGKDVHIGSGAVFMCVRAPIILGDKVMLGPNVTMITGDHRLDCVGKYMIDIRESEKLPENDLPIILKGDNWVGANSTILKGVTVGEGAVIAAGSLVTQDVPDYAIVGGVPAKVLKYRFNEEQLKEHKELLNVGADKE